jgi:hypothetical protein
MINKAMQQRKEKLEQNQNMIVEMRPEFAAALKKSISFSCISFFVCAKLLESNGRSAFLLKPSSKTKRKRQEIEEVKEEEQLLKSNKQAFL